MSVFKPLVDHLLDELVVLASNGNGYSVKGGERFCGLLGLACAGARAVDVSLRMAHDDLRPLFERLVEEGARFSRHQVRQRLEERLEASRRRQSGLRAELSECEVESRLLKALLADLTADEGKP